MNSRVRTVAFALLVIALSSIVLLQSFQNSVASIVEGRRVAVSANSLMPLQNANSTISSQSVSANSTALNSTAAQLMSSTPSVPQSSSAMENETTEISYLQYQMGSVNGELVAMSSSMSSLNQQAGMNTLIAEAGLIVAILAVIGAIAVARRADAMYRDASQSPPPGPAPAKQ